MTLAEFVAAMRKRWSYVVGAVLVLAGVAAVVSLNTAPTYQSTASVYFSLPVGSSASDLFQGSNYTQQQLGSYAELTTQPIVLTPVIEDLDLDITPRVLARQISAAVSAESSILEITASSGDTQRAADLANAVADALGTVVPDLSPNLANGDPSVKVVTTASATPAAFASSPNTRRSVFAAALAGLFLGLLAALAREKLDTRVRSEDDLPDGINALARIEAVRGLPQGAAARSSSSPSLQDTVRDESFRKLRTNLRFLDVSNPVQVIVVTSSVAGEGKTTAAINLARVLSEDGQRVLLVDADMRRSKVAEYLAIEGAVGLADVLAGTVSLEQAVQAWTNDRARILPSGSVPPNPSELLGSAAMAELIAQVRADYDHVVIDVPPMLPVTDATVVSIWADGVVLVVRHAKTTQKQLRTSLSALRAVEGRLLGVVLNRTPRPKPWQRRSAYYYDTRSGTVHQAPPARETTTSAGRTAVKEPDDGSD